MFGSTKFRLVHNQILPMQPHSLISEGTAISGFLAYVRWSIHRVNTARACWEHGGVVSRFTAGQMCFTGEFIPLRPARRRSEAFLMLSLFKVQRGVAARLLSKLYRHFHTPCQCLLNVEGLACSVCLHSEVADVLLQDYGGWTYAHFLTRLQDEIWACDAVYERMINCGLNLHPQQDCVRVCVCLVKIHCSH